MNSVGEALQDAAAARICQLVRMYNQDENPKNSDEWRRVDDYLGVPALAVERCPAAFTAKLLFEDRLDGWVICYNPHASETRICRFLAHETAEFLAVANYSDMFYGLPQYVFHYTGGSDPQDARHRIARRAEEMLCAHLPTRTPHSGQNLMDSSNLPTPGDMPDLPVPRLPPDRAADIEEMRLKISLFRDQVNLFGQQVAECGKLFEMQIEACGMMRADVKDEEE